MLGRLFCSFWCQKYNVLVANTAGFLKCSLHAMLRILLPKKKKSFSVFSVSQISYESICKNQD